MIKRDFPVVWTDRSDGASAWLARYGRDGYVVLRSVFDPVTIAAAKQCGAELAKGRFASTILESDGKTVRSVFDAHRLSTLISEEIVKNPALLGAVKEVLGPDVYIHQCHYNYKQPQAGGEFFWHSDYTFWHWEDGMRSPRAMTALIFLDQQRIETGPMMMVPGSHLWFMHTNWRRKTEDPNKAVRHGATDDPVANGLVDINMLRDLTSSRDVEVVLGRPGDVLLMDANIVHASGPNLGCHSRNILLLCFNSLHNTLGPPLSGGTERPGYISSREFVPL